MEIRVEHVIARPLGEVEAALLSPSHVSRIVAHGGIVAGGELRSIEEQRGAVVRVAHFVVSGAVDVGILGRVGRVGWTETVRYDRSSHEGEFEVAPDVPNLLAKRIRCRGNYRLVAEGPHTLRVIEARVDVNVPIVGREVEARVSALLNELFAEEAAVLAGAP